MSKPTESTRQELTQTLQTLLQSEGILLLEQTLRLEGWLRDLHPDLRAPVSVVMEGLHTGVYLESGSLADASALLSARSGLSPQWSDFAVRIWKDVLKEYKDQLGHTNAGHSSDHTDVKPVSLRTVDMVLASYKKG